MTNGGDYMVEKVLVTLIVLVICVNQSLIITEGSITLEQEGIDVGKVVEIIDGEVIKVFFYRRNFEVPVIETVRIIGVDTEASVDGFKYASERLLGKTIFLTYEEGFSFEPSDITYANVFYDFDRTFAEEILELGYAKVDDRYKGTTYYHEFLAAEFSAQMTEVGRFETTLSKTTDHININTATIAQLSEVLDISMDVAGSIADYRVDNKYNDITDIMAANKLFNAEWFDENRHLISVVTNINKASYLELSSLVGYTTNTQSTISDIDQYIRFNQITDLDELKTIQSFAYYYSLVKPYLTLDSSNIFVDDGKKRVNINTCSKETFMSITDLSSAVTKRLLELRDDGNYLIDSLEELTKSNYIFTALNSNKYTDKLTTYTNINTAGTYEMNSLLEQLEMTASERQTLITKIIKQRPYLLKSQLSSVVGSTVYESIKDYLYVYEDDIDSRYNINTTTKAIALKLDKTYEGKYTNYTNINRATKQVLLDINPDITVALAEEIIDYRMKHYFRYEEDLKQMFVDHKLLALYNRISHYLTYE